MDYVYECPDSGGALNASLLAEGYDGYLRELRGMIAQSTRFRNILEDLTSAGIRF